MSNFLKQFLQCYRNGVRPIALFRDRHRMLGNPHSIDKEETILAEGIRCYGSKLFIADGAHTTTLHLNVKRLRFYISHEHHHFERFHISTRSHQRTSDSNAEVTVVAELAYKLITVACRISNLLHISFHVGIGTFLAKHLFGNVHNICCMGLIKRKDESLREICKVRLTLWVVEHLRIYSITISCKNKLYLRRVDNRTVKFRLRVILSLSCVYLLRLAGVASFHTHTVAFQDSTTILCSLRLDAIHTVVHIHTIHNALFKRIVHNAVVVEERHGFGYWCSRKTNKTSRVEIFKHPSPVAVNASVTLINDNHVKEIVWQIRIVRKRNLSCCFIIVIIVDVFNVFTFQQ